MDPSNDRLAAAGRSEIRGSFLSVSPLPPPASCIVACSRLHTIHSVSSPQQLLSLHVENQSGVTSRGDTIVHSIQHNSEPEIERGRGHRHAPGQQVSSQPQHETPNRNPIGPVPLRSVLRVRPDGPARTRQAVGPTNVVVVDRAGAAPHGGRPEGQFSARGDAARAHPAGYRGDGRHDHQDGQRACLRAPERRYEPRERMKTKPRLTYVFSRPLPPREPNVDKPQVRRVMYTSQNGCMAHDLKETPLVSFS